MMLTRLGRVQGAAGVTGAGLEEKEEERCAWL
jgi:hypothetical protein